MKKIIAIIFVIIVLAIMMTGCGNRQIYDMIYNFNRAIIVLDDGTKIEGNVQSWRDFEDGDQLQVKIDGKTYLTAAENVLLIAE